jgi:hypothetical protein
MEEMSWDLPAETGSNKDKPHSGDVAGLHV